MAYTQEYIKQLQADFDAVSQTHFWKEFMAIVQERRNMAVKTLEKCKLEQVVYWQTVIRELDAGMRLPYKILGTETAPEE